MSRKLKKGSIDYYVEAVLDAGREGHPIDVFLLSHNIRKSDWDRYAGKHKAIRKAMNDAKSFAKAVALNKVDQLLHSKTVNGQVARLYLENTTGWGVSQNLADAAPPTIIINMGKTSAQMAEEERAKEEKREKTE